MSNTQLQQDTEFFETETEESQSLDSIQIPSTRQETEIPSDPVVVMQVLQVMDREREKEVRKCVEEREDVKDAAESTINKIMNIDSGIVGMFRVAFRGRVIPKDLSQELDILLEYEAHLTQYIDKVTNVIQNCRTLAAKADVDADRKNRLVLRQRAVMDLDNIREEKKLADLRERCAIFVEEIRKTKQKEE